MTKLLFWIGQNLLHFGLAKFMQEKLDAEYSAIIDCTNKPKTFFENFAFFRDPVETVVKCVFEDF